MNKVLSTDAKSYLSVRRVLLLSLTFSVGFHFILSLAFFFGESFDMGYGRSPERHQAQQRIEKKAPSDTLQICPSTPKPPHDYYEKTRGSKLKEFNGWRVLMYMSYSFILTCGVFFFNRRVMRMSFKQAWEELFFAILGSSLITILVSILFCYIPSLFETHRPDPHFMMNIIRDSLIRDLSMMAVVIMTCHLLRSLYRQNIIAIENEELRTKNIRTRYEALKNQMDPHFMFNSLNTLQSLIETDADEACDYVQKLSSVLRYTLQSKEVVTLADELNCVEAYCSMMQIRYGDNLVFDFKIDPKYHDYKVLPLSVQGLVENAIKHNVISAKQHLVIQVVTEDNNMLRVSNPIQPKLKEESEDGTGLVNLSERYRLQWDKNVEILDDGTTFVVILPLIEK